MRNTDTKRRRATLGGHRRDDHGMQMIVHFGRGHHDTRTRLPDFAPYGGIEIHEPNLPTHHQVSSASAALPNSPITSASSPASAIFLAASAQPVRTGLAGLRNTSAPPSMVISAPASALSPSCVRTGLGMTTPCELPICRMLTCMAFMLITILWLECGLSGKFATSFRRPA